MNITVEYVGSFFQNNRTLAGVFSLIHEIYIKEFKSRRKAKIRLIQNPSGEGPLNKKDKIYEQAAGQQGKG